MKKKSTKLLKKDVKGVYDIISEYSEGKAKFLDGYEGALIGIGERCDMQFPVAVYDLEKMITILMSKDKITRERAIEDIEFNTTNAWVGEGTPIFISKLL